MATICTSNSYFIVFTLNRVYCLVQISSCGPTQWTEFGKSSYVCVISQWTKFADTKYFHVFHIKSLNFIGFVIKYLSCGAQAIQVAPG